MKRRLFGVVLALLGSLYSLLSFAPATYAAGETYTVTDSVTIVGQGGAFTAACSAEGGKATFVWSGGANPAYVANCGADPNKPGTFKNTWRLVNVPYNYGLTVATVTGDITSTPTATGPNQTQVQIQTNNIELTLIPPPATADDAINCDGGPVIGWLICGIIKIITGIIDYARDNIILPLIKAPPLTQDGQNAPIYAIWSAMRNVASLFFILAFFLIIIGTAAGFDNYTIKKVLPHLVAGAILVPLSWYVCAAIIDISNVLGQGLVALISPLINIGGKPPTIDLSTGVDSLFFGTAGILAVGIGFSALTAVGLGTLFTVLIGVATAFVALVLRQILMTLFIILSPFTPLAWIFPNTEKWARRSVSNFIRLVMFYPYFMAFVEGGRLFSVTITATFGQTGFLHMPFHVAALGIPFLAAVPTAIGKPTGEMIALGAIWGSPVAAISTYPKASGAASAAGSKFIGRANKAAQGRYGKDSQLAKKMAEGKVRKAVESAKNAEFDAKTATGLRKAALGMKANAMWGRAGLGHELGIAGMGKLPGSTKLARSAATGKAAEELATMDAEARQGKEGTKEMNERFSQRRKSTAQTILDKKVDERAGRQGVLEGHSTGGSAQSTIDRHGAARINARENVIAGIGGAQGVVEDDRLNRGERGSEYVSPEMKVQAARTSAALNAAAMRGNARGIVQGTANAEARIEANITPAQLAAARISNPTITTADLARQVRLRTTAAAKANDVTNEQVTTSSAATSNVTTNEELDRFVGGGNATRGRSIRLERSAATASEHTRDELGLKEGGNKAVVDVEHAAGQERIQDLVGAGALATREQIAAARTLREARVKLQGNGRLPSSMSTSEVLEAAAEESGDRMSASVASQRQAIVQRDIDRARATNEDLPGADPTLRNKFLAAQDNAKAQTAKTSATRTAAANAVLEGTASTAAEETRAAQFEAGRNYATNASTTIGTAGTLEDKVTGELNRLTIAAARTGAPMPLRSQAEANVRNDVLNATRQVAQTAGEEKTAIDLNTDIGKTDTLNKEIDDQVLNTEMGRVQRANPLMSSESVRAQAERNIAGRPPAAALAARDQASAAVRSQHIESAGAAARNTAGTELSAQRQVVTSADRSLESQIADEQTRLQNLVGPTGTVPPGQAEANVRTSNIGAAATKARLETDRKNRQAADDALGVENDLNAEIAKQAGTGPVTEAIRAQAAATVAQRRLTNAGDTARTTAERGAAKQRGTEAGVASNIASEREAEAQKIRASMVPGAPMPTRAEFEAQVDRQLSQRNLDAINDEAKEHAALASRGESSGAIGTQTGLETQIEEEAQRLMDENPTLSPALAHARATREVEELNLSAAGTVARTAAIAAARKTNAANIGTEQEFNNSIDAAIKANPSLNRAQAEEAVIQQRADATANAARLKAAEDARKAASTEQGVKNNADTKIAAAVAAAPTPITRTQAENAILDRNLTAAGTVTETAAEIAADKAEEADIASAAAIDKLIDEEEAKLPAGTPDARLQARRNVLGAGGVAAGLAAADKTTKDIETDIGTKNDLESQIRTSGKTESEVRNERLTDAGVAARTAAQRAASKQRGQNKGVAKNIDEQIEREAKRLQAEDRRNAVRDAKAATAATGVYTAARPTITMDEARDRAEVGVLDRDLDALATKSTVDSGRQSRQETREAIGAKKAIDTLTRQEAERIVNRTARGAALTGPAREAAIQAAETQAAANVERTILNDAGQAAEITGQRAQIKTVKQDAGTIKNYIAERKKAPVEAARNSASNDAYNSAKAAGKTEEEALKAGKEAGDRAAELATRRVAGNFNIEDQERATILAEGVAAEESTMRQAANAAAQVIGLNQAATAPNALNPDQRITAQTEAVVKSLARESGAVRAAYDKPSGRSYQDLEQDATRVEKSKILLERSKEASKRQIGYEVTEEEDVMEPDLGSPELEADGTPKRDAGGNIVYKMKQVMNADGTPQKRPVMIDEEVAEKDPATGKPIPEMEADGVTPKRDADGKIKYKPEIDPATGLPKTQKVPKKRAYQDSIDRTDVNKDSIKAMKERAEKLLGDGEGDPEDEAEAIALMVNMSKTNAGRNAVMDIQEKIFGGNYDRNIDPAKFNGHAREIWEQVQDQVPIATAPFFTIPPAALYDGFAPEDFAKLGYAGKAQYFNFLNDTRQPSLYNEAARNIHSALSNPQVAKNLNSDDYQYMYTYLQDDSAREALAKVPGGLDSIRKIYKEGVGAGADGRFSREEAEKYNKWAQAQKDAAVAAKRAPLDPSDDAYKLRTDFKAGARIPVEENSDGTPMIDPATKKPVLKVPDPDTFKEDKLGEFLAKPPTFVPTAVAKNILEAYGKKLDPVAITQLANAYKAATTPGSTPTPEQTAFKTYIEGQIDAGQPIKIKDNDVIRDVLHAAPPIGPDETIPAAALAKLKTQAGKNVLDLKILEDANKAYRDDPAYKQKVKDAVMYGTDIPVPTTV